MLSEKEFLKEEKECADLLGMTKEQYHEYVNNTKIPTNNRITSERKYDNTILKS